MARYIDADEFGTWLANEYFTFGRIKEIPPVITAVHRFPQADVVPVIHAEWIGVNPLADTIECSHCGYEWFTCEIATPYCPECGATMDNYKEIGEIGLPDVEVL